MTTTESDTTTSNPTSESMAERYTHDGFVIVPGVLCLVTSVVAVLLPTLIAVFEDPVKVVRSA